MRNLNDSTSNLRNLSNKKKFYITLLCVAILSFICGANLRNIVPVALVNGEKISRPIFTQQLLKIAGQQVMSNLIAEKLIYQEAKKRHVSVTKGEVAKKVADIVELLDRQHLTLKDLLVSQGRTKPELENEIKLQLTIEKLFKNQLTITTREIDQYFVTSNIKRAEGALFESQKIAIINNIRRDKLRNALTQWIGAQKNTVKIQYLIKM